MADQIRNKYNTLTPAEAKKLNRYLIQRTPIRTASVLNKPRAPPIVVTNLDDNHDDGDNNQLNTSAATDQDRTITNNNENEPELGNQRCRQLNYHHHDSLSNLSFRSSRDTPDCVTIQRNLQTMSVDLSGRNQQNYRLPPAYDPVRHQNQQQRMLRNLPKRSNTLNTRISDDSFSSAKSDFFNVSGRSSSVTPTKFTRFPTNSVSATPEPIRSASKPSLSSSTYKVLQSPLANFKRLFRGIQRPFSQAASHQRASATSATRQQVASNKTSTAAAAAAAATKRQQQDSSLADLSLSDSISCVSLNKSQSPTVLPPPPSELKSLGYLESSCIDYSNYDDFTKTRNERLLRQTNSRPNSRSNESGDLQQLSFGKSGDSDDSSWQMTSLPVYFERNLTTVFEERHQQKPPPAPPVLTAEQLAIKLEARQRRRLTQIISPLDLDRADSRASDQSGCERIYQSIKPPRRFDDSSSSLLVVDPSLELQRRQPASPFRFSFGQPLSFVTDNQAAANTNLGLPPRLPTGQQQQQKQQQQQSSQQHQLMPTNHSKNNSEIQSRHHDNSSSGNSSNCSSQMNVINYCDRQDSSTTATTGKNLESTNSAYSLEAHHDLYGNLDEVNDPNSTLQSESSTIRGESNLASFYANKFAEFERTIASLKNKLIVKEKELTELQLVQLNSDYTIERIKERLVKLERENQQLRAMTNGNPNRDTVYC